MKSPRTTKPEKGNKYFTRKASGGYSTCIKGKPTDKDTDVLANCVGCGNGCYNEQLDLGYEKYHLNCDAENFIERAIASGLSVYKKPMVGGILVWAKGEPGVHSDGAGHVAYCTKVDDIYDPKVSECSESAYGGKAFYRTSRKIGSGNWGMNEKYTYRGCIAPPGWEPPVPPVPPTPTYKYKVGTRVKIIAKGNANSYGTGHAAYGIGWIRYVTKIYEGRPYPYQVGNKGSTASKDTTGFYKESALKEV
jgi:surface antigen